MLTEEGAAMCRACIRRETDGRMLCSHCVDNLTENLAEVAERYDRLDATPGKADAGSRGAPGFRSSPPGSLHVMAMRDPRSTTTVRHGDDERRAPLPVQATLMGLAVSVRAERGLTYPPPPDVPGLVGFLRVHVDWLSRHELGVEATRTAHALRAQLRPVTGDPRPKPVGHCLEDGCGAAIYLPDTLPPRAPDEPIRDMPAVTCPRCRSEYDGRRLIILRLAEEAA